MFLRTSAPTRAAPRRPCAASAARRRAVAATARPASATAISSAPTRGATRPRPRPTAEATAASTAPRASCSAAVRSGPVRGRHSRSTPSSTARACRGPTAAARATATGSETLEECLASVRGPAGPEWPRGRPGRAGDLPRLRPRRRLLARRRTVCALACDARRRGRPACAAASLQCYGRVLPGRLLHLTGGTRHAIDHRFFWRRFRSPAPVAAAA